MALRQHGQGTHLCESLSLLDARCSCSQPVHMHVAASFRCMSWSAAWHGPCRHKHLLLSGTYCVPLTGLLWAKHAGSLYPLTLNPAPAPRVSNVLPADQDILVVRELRNLINDAHQRAKVAPRTADEAAKWLEWPQYLQVVHELRSSPCEP